MNREASAVAGAPAPLRDMEGLTPRNEARLFWWAIRARLHGAGGWWLAAPVAVAILCAWIVRGLGTGAAGVTFAVVLVGFAACCVVLLAAVQLLFNARRRRRWLVGYFTADASQLVHPDPAGAWVLSDHFARRRGHGLAAAFRRQVFAHLAAEADRHQVAIVMDTHAEKLAHIYAQDMPGLHVVAQRRTINGRTFTLQRDPHPASS